jgi:AcrR family transcriptional regulator
MVNPMSAGPSVTETAPAESPGRGRPREFDQEAVLEALTQLFWEKGYESTSMADIVEATGLNKSSLYNAFGSKDELFDRAIGRYVDSRAKMLGEMVEKGTHGIDDVLMMLDALWMEVEAGDHRGCLAVNTSTELGPDNLGAVEISERYRTLMRHALTTAFSRAADLGEIDRAHVENYANTIMALMLGLAVVVRGGASNDELRMQVDSARAVLEGWRTPR